MYIGAEIWHRKRSENDKKGKWYQGKYIHEAGFFIAMFILTMLHEWIELDTVAGFMKGLAFFLILYALAQFHRFIVFPLFLQKRYGRYTIISIFTTLAGGLLLYACNYYWFQPAYYQQEDMVMEIIYHFVLMIISTITIMSLFLIRQYSMELQRRNQDRLVLSEMNLKYLHAQLNPHFFFNMFNNIYGVSLTDPGRVPGLILKLSNLMRYQLENVNRNTVSISDEIDFINNYIVMEQQRIGKRCDISFVYPENNTIAAGFQIAPLILITLVENAFKHSLTILNRWFVSIHIEIIDNTLKVNVCNSLPDGSLKNGSTGIGLVNIRQHLEMLYKGNYQFVSTCNEQEYQTTLTLKLNNL